jgi:murein L,D-transpeptidase YcbB/YkuD
LFARADRALSHGCIRVQDPLPLAEAVLNAPEWTLDALNAEIEAGGTHAVRLASPLPIYVLYMTAAVSDGAVNYADDVYDRDSRVVDAIDAPDTAPATGPTGPASECSR